MPRVVRLDHGLGIILYSTCGKSCGGWKHVNVDTTDPNQKRCRVVCAGLSVGVVASAGGVFPSGQHLLVGPPPVWNQSRPTTKAFPPHTNWGEPIGNWGSTRHRLLVSGHFEFISNAACGIFDNCLVQDIAYWFLATLIFYQMRHVESWISVLKGRT
jgi:hypothetical protein